VYFVSVFALVNSCAALFALMITKHIFPNHQLYRTHSYMCVTLVSTLKHGHAVLLCVSDNNKKKKEASEM
jgi:hypothetical protein